jgi:hypothetical protein
MIPKKLLFQIQDEPMMNRQEQHWQKLFGHLTTEKNLWYGNWLAYSPDKEVIKSSQGIRILQANEERSIITHTNQFPSPDGQILEKSWQIEKSICNLADGLLHPANPQKRALALLGQGSSAWVSQKLELGQPFSVELFLKSETENTSIGSIYNESGHLEKIFQIREHLGSDPEPPAPELESLSVFSGNWQGSQQSITADLTISPVVEMETMIIDPTHGTNAMFLLVDRVVVIIPKKLNLGDNFDIIAGQIMSDHHYQRLTAQYDNSGNFTRLIGELFAPKPNN